MDKYVVGLFDDEDTLLKAIPKIKEKGLKIEDVRTPFPVHGLDDALGLKQSRLHTVGFFAGATGTLLALSFMIWITTSDYPTNFGGKPFLSFPSYIPIAFEFTVLMAAVTMVIAFFIRCGLSPVKEPRIFDPRLTDYMFGMIFNVNESSEAEIELIKSTLESNGVAELKEKDFDEEEY